MSERDDRRLLTQGLTGIGVVALVVATIALLGLALATITALVF